MEKPGLRLFWYNHMSLLIARLLRACDYSDPAISVLAVVAFIIIFDLVLLNHRAEIIHATESSPRLRFREHLAAALTASGTVYSGNALLMTGHADFS